MADVGGRWKALECRRRSASPMRENTASRNTPLRYWQKSPLKIDNACNLATLFDFASVISL
ncbi:hypothetical protein [Candidatus Burkholderia verschuerenii]|uniref:hypothetical protein n=1 Tax=Candidatus Burkholderia verschuerenii TaxID=242163 RepID=UPI0018DDC457|nr:hypothetical protein [Candidatus Burkholderia verschuerenii]